MRCLIAIFTLLVAATVSSVAASGKVVKVLPHFLDLKGRHTLSPSLYDRDAYQARLRQHPEQRSGVRFDILWRGRGVKKDEKASLIVELRGAAKADLPTRAVLELPVKITGTSHWSKITLDGEEYKNFGEITAWRVTLWVGDELIGEQKSFLW